jgi:HEAT repeat protein
MKRKWCVLAVLGIVMAVPPGVFATEKSSSVKQLVDNLNKSKNQVEIQQLINDIALTEPRSEREIDVLAGLVLNDDDRMSRCGAQSMALVTNKELFPKIVALVNEKNDERLKIAAIVALGKLKDGRAVPVLINCLNDDGMVAHQAALALVEINDPQAIPGLLSRVENNDASLGFALAEFGAPALNAIAGRIDSITDEEAKARVIQTIGFIHDPQARETFKVLLKNKDANARSLAVQALGNMNDASIITALRDEDGGVRLFAVEALRNIDDAKINDSLIDVFNNDKDTGVRIMTADALGYRKCKGALPALNEALKDENERIQKAAADAIEKISHPQE